jgi:hypothetical protein
MMIYAERVKKQVEAKDLGLSDEFWAEATGWLIDCTINRDSQSTRFRCA